MNMRRINFCVLAINIIIALWIVMYSSKSPQNSTSESRNSNEPIEILQRKSESLESQKSPKTPEVVPPASDVGLDVVSVPRELASYLGRFSNVATDRSPFTEDLLSTIGFSENGVVLSRILNNSTSKAVDIERQLAKMEWNSLGEQVLKIESNNEFSEEIHNSLINELSKFLTEDTAEFIWMKTRGKILGNLRFQKFTMTRHDDAQSGEQQFVIEKISEGDPASSILYEPINSSSIPENYGHLISNFKF